MPAKKKPRGGRVTPKGTANPTKKKADPPASEDTLRDLPRPAPRKAMREKGRGARPITHHRGNR